MSRIAAKWDWFVTTGLCNGYHHIDIGWKRWKYLGFSFPTNGRVMYFVFTSLPFGLTTTPFLFTKFYRPL